MCFGWRRWALLVGAAVLLVPGWPEAAPLIIAQPYSQQVTATFDTTGPPQYFMRLDVTMP